MHCLSRQSAAVVACILLLATGASSSSSSWELASQTLPPWAGAFFEFSPQGVADDPLTGNIIFSGRWILHEVAVTLVNDSGISSRSSRKGRGNSTKKLPDVGLGVGNGTSHALPSYNMTTVRVLPNAIPDFLQKEGFDHIGDVDFINATRQVVAPVEEPSWTRPKIVVYNQTAENYTYAFQANASAQGHCPWVAFAPFAEQGLSNWVLSSEYDHVEKVFAYDFPSLAYRHELLLEKVGESGLMHVQGGVVRDFKLYLSTDQNVNPNGHNIFVFDLTAVVHAEQPNAPLLSSFKQTIEDGFAEIEGLTIDAKERMWLVTNMLAVDSMIYTLEKRSSKR